jgi:hypothetical protein
MSLHHNKSADKESLLGALDYADDCRTVADKLFNSDALLAIGVDVYELSREVYKLATQLVESCYLKATDGQIEREPLLKNHHRNPVSQFCCIRKELKEARVELKSVPNQHSQRAANLRRLIATLEEQLSNQANHLQTADLCDWVGAK